MDTCQWAKQLVREVVEDTERKQTDRIAKDLIKFGVWVDRRTGLVIWPNQIPLIKNVTDS